MRAKTTSRRNGIRVRISRQCRTGVLHANGHRAPESTTTTSCLTTRTTRSCRSDARTSLSTIEPPDHERGMRMISRRLTVLIGALALLAAAVPAAVQPATASGVTPSGVTPSDRSGADASSVTAAADVPTEPAGGGIILFDQLTTRAQVGVGLPVQRFDPPNARDAEGADDFQVL